MKRITIALLILLISSVGQADEKLANYLQDISVTIKSPGYGGGQGSGVILTKSMFLKKGDKEKVSVTFVFTAGHVVDNLRSVRSIINESGSSKKVIEFADAYIVQETIQNGRRVGEKLMDAQVLRYSDSENGEDLALLMVRKYNFSTASLKFHLDKKPLALGTKLYHVGSLFGQFGSNSMTDGIMSKVGRVLDIGNKGGVTFDQTTVGAFPGSSGGGIYFQEGPNAGKYIGMIVRGSEAGFNFMVPMRRIESWAERNKIKWLLYDKMTPPTVEELLAQSVDDKDVPSSPWKVKKENNKKNKTYFLFERDLVDKTK